LAKNDFEISGVLKMRKTRLYVKCLLSLTLLTFVVGCVGCDINFGDFGGVEFERTEQLSAPIAAGSTLTAETQVGSIIVTGADVTDCNVTATITAKAPTQEEAEKLAHKVKIKLEPEGDDLRLHVEKPEKKRRRSIEVSFDITIGTQTNLQLESNVGEIVVSNISGTIKATTNVGDITCTEAASDVDLETNVGEVIVAYSSIAESTFEAELETNVGDISFAGPTELSAKVNASTNIGSIETRLPLTVTGKIAKSVHGTIGKGEVKATVRLRTNVGSIEIE
jgi:hypothetical protein